MTQGSNVSSTLDPDESIRINVRFDVDSLIGKEMGPNAKDETKKEYNLIENIVLY
jgi:hypothetical protein